MAKKIVVDGTVATMQIWDTAGQERFRALGVTFFRGADCCVLVFDVTMAQTFENLDDWHSTFLEQSGCETPETFPFVLVGNKIDLESRAIDGEQAAEWALAHNMQYFECSARESLNVEQAFTAVAELALQQYDHNQVVLAREAGTYTVDLSTSAENGDKPTPCAC
mmetsp:Transcript_37074/g.97172  ORF Transcript_37074/g.97172 Transcript_37074/m.97172 type:complete len:165 (-) Transcript_37074:214-708(-)